MKEYLKYIWSFRFFRWVIYLNLLIHLYSFVEFHQQRYSDLIETKYLCGLNLNQDQNSKFGFDLFSSPYKLLPSKYKSKKQPVLISTNCAEAIALAINPENNVISHIDIYSRAINCSRAPPAS
ncbi:MAG: hypothetical protein VX642_10695 [Bdellovibrionota bacterium]|nr:hypothetical protein [Bdellovibrionota bacterium]